jgi:hypothetical protein
LGTFVYYVFCHLVSCFSYIYIKTFSASSSLAISPSFVLLAPSVSGPPTKPSLGPHSEHKEMAATRNRHLGESQTSWRVTWILILKFMSVLLSVRTKSARCSCWLCNALGAIRSGVPVCLRKQRKGFVRYVEHEPNLVVSRMATRSDSRLYASPADNLAPDRTPKLATTFGIEFECIFAIHESELHRVLEENLIVASVQKDLLREEQKALLGKRQITSHRRSHFPC